MYYKMAQADESHATCQNKQGKHRILEYKNTRGSLWGLAIEDKVLVVSKKKNRSCSQQPLGVFVLSWLWLLAQLAVDPAQPRPAHSTR